MNLLHPQLKNISICFIYAAQSIHTRALQNRWFCHLASKNNRMTEVPCFLLSNSDDLTTRKCSILWTGSANFCYSPGRVHVDALFNQSARLLHPSDGWRLSVWLAGIGRPCRKPSDLRLSSRLSMAIRNSNYFHESVCLLPTKILFLVTWHPHRRHVGRHLSPSVSFMSNLDELMLLIPAFLLVWLLD